MVKALATLSTQVQSQYEVASRRPGILVVDDESSVRGLLKIVLESQGFDVWLVSDGCEALKLYCRFRSQIDLVLLDVRMPGWDGPRTLAELRQMNPDLPCCFMTGQAGQYCERQLLGLGASRVFAKPFALNSLRMALWKLAVKAETLDA
jgi:CheY-like chemotaxis protein